MKYIPLLVFYCWGFGLGDFGEGIVQILFLLMDAGENLLKKNYFEKYQPVWVSSSTFSAVFLVNRLTIIIARIAITNA